MAGRPVFPHPVAADVKLRYAILLGLTDSLVLAWALGSYNGSVPPPGSPWTLVAWPTGSTATLFLPLFLIWFSCLLCVSWKGAGVPSWQLMIAVAVTAGTLGAAWYLADGIWKMVRK